MLGVEPLGMEDAYCACAESGDALKYGAESEFAFCALCDYILISVML